MATNELQLTSNTVKMDHATAREFFTYCPDSGELRWRVRTTMRVKIGDIAGTVRHGRATGLTVGGERLLAHRIAWLYVFGEWPRQFIDHINGDPSDNRLCNLRDVSPLINSQNLRKAMSTNKSTGLLGAARHKSGRFSASISIDGKLKHLGYFSTAVDAHEKYIEAKRELHAGCTI